MEIDMPEEGWGLHVQEFYCPVCKTHFRAESLYTHPELEEKMGITQEELSLELHCNDVHSWNEIEKRWQ